MTFAGKKLRGKLDEKPQNGLVAIQTNSNAYRAWLHDHIIWHTYNKMTRTRVMLRPNQILHLNALKVMLNQLSVITVKNIHVLFLFFLRSTAAFKTPLGGKFEYQVHSLSLMTSS